LIALMEIAIEICTRIAERVDLARPSDHLD
jgi:hypothetical protein